MLIPRRIIEPAKYKGLNVHPSLLPDLRGPAPLPQALLEGRKTSGITVQTLHPEHFDLGGILLQRPFDLPNHGDCSMEELRNHVTPRSADLLMECLQEGTFTEPDKAKKIDYLNAPSPTKKVRTEGARINWQTWDSGRILRTQRAMRSVWSSERSRKTGGCFRIRWHDLQPFPAALSHSPGMNCFLGDVRSPGEMRIIKTDVDPDGHALRTEQERVVVTTCDGQALTPRSVTISGRRSHEQAVQAITLVLDGTI